MGTDYQLIYMDYYFYFTRLLQEQLLFYVDIYIILIRRFGERWVKARKKKYEKGSKEKILKKKIQKKKSKKKERKFHCGN